MNKRYESLQPNLHYVYFIRDAMDSCWTVVNLGTSDKIMFSPGEHLLKTIEYKEVQHDNITVSVILQYHWNGNVVMLRIYGLLIDSPEVVNMTTCSAASDENGVNLITSLFQWWYLPIVHYINCNVGIFCGHIIPKPPPWTCYMVLLVSTCIREPKIMEVYVIGAFSWLVCAKFEYWLIIFPLVLECRSIS